LEKKIAAESNTYPFWQYVKSKTKSCSGVANLIKEDRRKREMTRKKPIYKTISFGAFLHRKLGTQSPSQLRLCLRKNC
jgi:hypothetical protein